ncbi:hypothetical protein WG628_09415 [Stenotrophomonas maltophilia]
MKLPDCGNTVRSPSTPVTSRNRVRTLPCWNCQVVREIVLQTLSFEQEVNIVYFQSRLLDVVPQICSQWNQEQLSVPLLLARQIAWAEIDSQ